MTMTLARNSIIQTFDPADRTKFFLDRILWVSVPIDIIIFIRLSDKKALPVQQSYSSTLQLIPGNSSLLSPSDPYVYLKGLPSTFLEKHSESTYRAYKIIKELADKEDEIFDSKSRGRLVKQAARDHSVTKAFIYKMLRKYWQRGTCLEALLPDFQNCGAPGKEKHCGKWDECTNHVCTAGQRCPNEVKRGRPSSLLMIDQALKGVNVIEADRQIFEIAIRLYYHTGEKHPLQRAYDEMNANFYSNGVGEKYGGTAPVLMPANQRPTFEQFRYWYLQRRNVRQELIARKGHRGFELNHRPLLGNSTSMAVGPGSIFMIDATIADITIVTQLGRKIIGRPILYFVIDLFSRMIVGFHICLRGPSWEGAAMAIANAASNKVEFCAKYGVYITDYEWPCHHLSESIMADRGEMICNASDGLIIYFNISVANCAPYRPDWKAVVERYFKTTNEKILHWLPGDTRKRDFGNPDNRYNATLDIKELTKIMIYEILKHNNTTRIENYPLEQDMIASGVEPIPWDLWAWGIENRVGRLREESRETLICKLFPRTTATVTASGIKSSLGLHYITESATELQWFERARNIDTWPVDLAIDPLEIGKAYLIGNNGAITPCTLLPRDEQFSYWSSNEIEEHNALQRLKSRLHKGTEQQGEADTIALTNQVIAEAERKTAMARELNPPPSKSSLTQNIRTNRAAEHDQIRLETALEDGVLLSPGKNSSLKPTGQKEIPIRQTCSEGLLNSIKSICEVPDD